MHEARRDFAQSLSFDLATKAIAALVTPSFIDENPSLSPENARSPAPRSNGVDGRRPFKRPEDQHGRSLTLIVRRKGAEIGRIVETPQASLQEDLAAILAGPIRKSP